MKKTLLILILLTTVKIYSQHKLDSVIYNSSYKAEMLYNSDNKNTSYKEYGWNSSSSSWEYGLYGLDYYYDNTGNIDYAIFEESTFHNKYEYLYNSDNKIIEKKRLDQNGSNWDLIYTETYNYDSAGNNIEIIRINENTSWNTNYRYINTFDSANNIILKEKQEWNSSSNSYDVTNEKYEYQYNSNNKILNRIAYDLVDGVFKQVGKYEYNYDSFGNRNEFISYIYDENTNSWNGEEKVTYLYDNNFSFSDLVIPNWKGILDIGYDEDYNHMITSKSYYEWDNVQNQWTYYSDAIFYWDNTTASINDIQNVSVSIYPNPTTNQVKFDITDFEKIKIYDITGKLITKTKTNIVNMENVPSGTYLYRIQKGNETISGKIIKK